jgi:hypothetical protein
VGLLVGAAPIGGLCSGYRVGVSRLSLSFLIRGMEHDSLFSPSAYCYWPPDRGVGEEAKKKGKQTLRKEQERNLKIRIQTKFQVYN